MKPTKITFTSALSCIVTLTLLLTFVITTAFTPSAPQSSPGESLYKKNCMRCHGADGAKGMFGAKNLKQSQLDDAAIVQQIQNGKGFMPAFKKKLTPQELDQIVSYVKRLRNTGINF